jgi:hypothetical protein
MTLTHREICHWPRWFYVLFLLITVAVPILLFWMPGTPNP